MYPLGKTLTEILPGGIDVQSHRWFSLNADADMRWIMTCPMVNAGLSIS